MVAQQGRGGGRGGGPGSGGRGGGFSGDSQGLNGPSAAAVPPTRSTFAADAAPAASPAAPAAPPAVSPNNASAVSQGPPQALPVSTTTTNVVVVVPPAAAAPPPAPSSISQSPAGAIPAPVSTSSTATEPLTTAIPIVEPDLTQTSAVSDTSTSFPITSTTIPTPPSTFLTRTTPALSTLETASPTAPLQPILLHQPSNSNSKTAGMVSGIVLLILFIGGLAFFLFRRISKKRRPDSGTTWSETPEKPSKLPPFEAVWHRISFALSFDNLSKKSNSPPLGKDEDFFNRPLSIKSKRRSQFLSRLRSPLGTTTFVNGQQVSRNDRSAAKPFESPREFAAERMPNILTPPPQDSGPPAPQLFDLGSLLRSESFSSEKTITSKDAVQNGSGTPRDSAQDYFTIQPIAEKSFIGTAS